MAVEEPPQDISTEKSSLSLPQPTSPLTISSSDILPSTLKVYNNASGTLSSWRLAIVVMSLCMGTLLVAIDTTIISVAIPKIATDFKALDNVGFYGSAYLLTVTAFQPAFGSIYKFFNAKAIYVFSIVAFEVGSILCAAAPGSTIFIVGRAIAGVGAAGLYQGGLGIIGLTVKLEKRPMYLGIVMSVFGIAVCLGPPLGGILTDHVSWRWCFWINLPIGAVSFILILIFLKLQQDGTKRKETVMARIKLLDIPGIVTIIAAVTCLLVALEWGGSSKAWNSATVVGLIVGFGLLMMGFVVVQWKKGETATVPLRVFRQRSVFNGAIFSFLLEMGVYVPLFYMPFYFQSAQGVDATTSGVRGIPLGIAQIFSVMVTGGLVTLTGHYVPFMVLGQVVSIIGHTLLARINVDTTTAVWATFLIICGLGHGMGLQTPFTAMQVVLHDDDIFVGNAIVLFFSQLGASISVAIAQSVFVNSLQTQVPKFVPSIPASVVIAAGPTGLQALTTDSVALRALRDAYAIALQNVIYVSLAAVTAALPFAVGMEWLNVKKVAKQREEKLGNLSEESLSEKTRGSCSETGETKEKKEESSKDSLLKN